MQKTYSVDICGKIFKLPVLQLPAGGAIAFFNLHGNAALTEYCAEHMLSLVKGADVILTAESKGLQLAHCLAVKLGHTHYAVARKSQKLYMQDGISVSVKSITTNGEQKLYLSSHDSALMRGHRVAIVDDVISTGGSLRGLEELAERSGGTVFVKAAILAEGDAAARQDIKYLQSIPLL